MLFAAEFGTGQVLWSMLWFFLFFMWIMLVFRVFGDIFRDQETGGFAKVLWIVFIIVLPFLGVFVYLIARGNKMAEREVASIQDEDLLSTRTNQMCCAFGPYSRWLSNSTNSQRWQDR